MTVRKRRQLGSNVELETQTSHQNSVLRKSWLQSSKRGYDRVERSPICSIRHCSNNKILSSMVHTQFQILNPWILVHLHTMMEEGRKREQGTPTGRTTKQEAKRPSSSVTFRWRTSFPPLPHLASHWMLGLCQEGTCWVHFVNMSTQMASFDEE